MLRDVQQGRPVADICGGHNISNVQFYRWRSKYSGKDCSKREEHEPVLKMRGRSYLPEAEWQCLSERNI
jgi:hypothetical protein